MDVFTYIIPHTCRYNINIGGDPIKKNFNLQLHFIFLILYLYIRHRINIKEIYKKGKNWVKDFNFIFKYKFSKVNLPIYLYIYQLYIIFT